MRKYLPFILLFIPFQQLSAQKYYQFKYETLPRSYIVYTPKNFNPSENLPLVINMHGFSTDAAFHMDYTDYNKTADTARCIVVYPNGWEKRWSTGTTFGINTGIDDVGFLSEMMDRLIVIYNVNAKKIFATGYSAGGFMSYKLGCDLTSRVAAIAPNAGSMTYDNYDSCVPTRVLPLIAANGTADAIVPLNGIPDNFPNWLTVVNFWQQHNGCDLLPLTDTLPNLVSNDGSRVVRYTFTNCTNGIITNYYRILNGGHTWPGAEDAFLGVLGNTNEDISWNNETWQFFKTNEVPSSLICDAPTNLQVASITIDSFQLSWDAVPGVDTFKIAMIDSSNAVTFYKTTATVLHVKIDAGNRYRWNVASNCPSRYRNWTTTRSLLTVPTFTKNNYSQALILTPNPASGYIQIGHEEPIGNFTQIRVFNSIGREVTGEISVSDNLVSIQNLPKGIYLLSLQTSSRTRSGIFMKL